MEVGQQYVYRGFGDFQMHFKVARQENGQTWVKVQLPEFDARLEANVWSQLFRWEENKPSLDQCELEADSVDVDGHEEVHDAPLWVLINYCRTEHERCQSLVEFPDPEYLGIDDLEVGRKYHIATGMFHPSFEVTGIGVPREIRGVMLADCEIRLIETDTLSNLLVRDHYTTRFARGEWHM